MKQDFYERYKSTINTVALVGAAAASYAIYRGIKRKRDEELAFRDRAIIEQELARFESEGYEARYPDSTYFTMAEALVQAMSGCGKDFSKVLSVFSSLTNSVDYAKLHLAFGVRYYEPCFWSSPWQLVVYQFNNKAYGGDLPAWLYYDLSTEQLKQINRVLQERGIDYAIEFV